MAISDETTLALLDDALRALGQMEHLHSRECHHAGVMTMRVDARRELIARLARAFHHMKEKVTR